MSESYRWVPLPVGVSWISVDKKYHVRFRAQREWHHGATDYSYKWEVVSESPSEKIETVFNEAADAQDLFREFLQKGLVKP